MDWRTHMCEHLLRQPAPLSLLERLVKAQEPPAALQAVPGHLELVHRVHILDKHLDAWAVWCFCGPEVQIFVPPRFEVKRVVAVVQISELGEEVEVVFRVELCVYTTAFVRPATTLLGIGALSPFLTCGNRASRSFMRCLIRWVIPLEDNISTLCLFFNFFGAGVEDTWVSASTSISSAFRLPFPFASALRALPFCALRTDAILMRSGYSNG